MKEELEYKDQEVCRGHQVGYNSLIYTLKNNDMYYQIFEIFIQPDVVHPP